MNTEEASVVGREAEKNIYLAVNKLIYTSQIIFHARLPLNAGTHSGPGTGLGTAARSSAGDPIPGIDLFCLTVFCVLDNFD